MIDLFMPKYLVLSEMNRTKSRLGAFKLWQRKAPTKDRAIVIDMLEELNQTYQFAFKVLDFVDRNEKMNNYFQELVPKLKIIKAKKSGQRGL